MLKYWVVLTLCCVSFNLQAQVSPWVEFKLENGHIKMPITANGVEGYAILDSGSQVNAINNYFRKQHDLQLSKGQKIKIQGIYGTEDRSTYNGLTVGMFGSEVKMSSLVGMNFGGRDVALLLGETFLKQFIFQFDYPNSKLRFAAHGTFNMSDIENIKMVKKRGSGTPLVSVKMNNEVDVWLILDTGNAGGVMVERSLANSNGWLDKFKTQDILMQGVNTLGNNEAFRIPEFQFGPYTLEDVLVVVPAEGQNMEIGGAEDMSFSRIKGKRVRGLLGYDVLKHFLLTIDYRSGNAHIGVP